MAGKDIRDRNGGGHLGWWLVVSLTLANVAAVLAATTASLAFPALALLACAAAIPTRSWVAAGERRVTDGAGRVVAALALPASWAAAVGADSIGWVGTSAATALFFGWVAALGIAWAGLRRLPLLRTASALITAGLAAAAALTPDFTLSLVPVQVLLTGVTSASFMPAVMLGGLTALASSLTSLALTLPHLRGATPMHSLAQSFAGLTGLALVGTVVSSTPVPAEWLSRTGLVPLAIGLALSVALLAAGLFTARTTPLSRRGTPLTGLALVATAAGGWFSFTAQGLALVAAMILVVLATVFALVSGTAAASAIVRDGHRVRARLAASTARRATATAPANAAPATAPTAAGMPSPQHATG